MLEEDGYSGQQDEQLSAGDRPDNLFKPVDRDMGSHGRFDNEARTHSWQLWATMHRKGLMAAALLAPAALLLLRRKR